MHLQQELVDTTYNNALIVTNIKACDEYADDNAPRGRATQQQLIHI